MRRPTLLVAALTLVLTGCSDDATDAAAEPTGEMPSFPTSGPALWNPCDGLELTEVQRALSVELSVATGSPDAPQCTFTPTQDGEPALDVNYQLYPGSLEELVDTFGVPTEGSEIDVTTPDVLDADDARLIVSVVDDTLAVTGFVQNGDLVQTVDVIDPQPYDQARVVRGVREVLAAFSAAAP